MITTTSLTLCQTYIANVDRVCWFSSSGSLQSKAIQKYNYDLAEVTKSAGFQHPKLQELIPTRLKRVSWFTSCHAKIRSKADLPLPAVPASKTGALMASKRRKRSWKATWNQKHERWWCGRQPENRDQPKDFKAKVDMQWCAMESLSLFEVSLQQMELSGPSIIFEMHA